MTALDPIGHGRIPDRPPTSREINSAIELLRGCGADQQAMTLLDRWNANRLVSAAQTVETLEELRNLFAGMPPILRSFAAGIKLPARTDVDEGAWS